MVKIAEIRARSNEIYQQAKLQAKQIQADVKSRKPIVVSLKQTIKEYLKLAEKPGTDKDVAKQILADVARMRREISELLSGPAITPAERTCE